MKASIFMLFDLFTMPKQLHCVEVSETVRKSSHQRKSIVVNGHETEMTDPVENVKTLSLSFNG